MTGIIFPDLSRSLLPAIEFGRQMDADRKQAEVGQYVPQALQGDQNAFAKLAQLSPQHAMAIQGHLERLDAQTRAKLKDELDVTARTAAGILSLPEQDQPAAYETAYQQLKGAGYNLNGLPPQWHPSLKPRLQASAIRSGEYLKMLEGQPQPMPMPGGAPGAAPASGPDGLDLGKARNTIGGIEAGGQKDPYRAVGPVANAAGNRAYGRYQVMDFNIGPWTQEVLGRPMTPQEFLNDDKAQDAVFDAKFTQFARQHGGPEAAAKVWFGGPGALRNPGSRDVLGTSVAGYADRFRQGYGGPQPAPMPQPPTALANAGTGAVPMPRPPGNLMPFGPPPAEMPGAPAGLMPFGPPPNEVPAPLSIRVPQRPPSVPMPPGPPPAAMPGGMPGAPQVAQGDSVPGMSPAPAGAAPSVGTEVMDIRRQTRAQGGDIFTVRGMPEIKDGHYVVRSLQDPRVVVGMVPVKAKERETGGMFPGNSVEANALNQLVATGVLTPQQALELAAGKVITDPSTGQLIFKRPTELVGVSGASAAPGAVPGAPAAPGAAPGAAPQGTGGVPLTPPKSQVTPKEQSDLRAAKADGDTIINALEDFRNEVKKAGFWDKTRSLFGATTPLNTSYNAAALLAKGEALFNLGVLNGPDLDIIRRTLPDPSTVRGGFSSEADMDAAVNKVQELIRSRIAAKEKQLGIAPSNSGGQTYIGPDNTPISQAEVEATAKNRGISVDEVIQRLGLKPAGAR